MTNTLDDLLEALAEADDDELDGYHLALKTLVLSLRATKERVVDATWNDYLVGVAEHLSRSGFSVEPVLHRHSTPISHADADHDHGPCSEHAHWAGGSHAPSEAFEIEMPPTQEGAS